MKNYVKAVVTFVFLMAAVAFVPNVADAAVGAPGNLRQTGASASSVKFEWDAVTNADDYETSYSTDGANWSDWDSDRSSWYGTTATINKRSPGSTYYVKVRAVEDGATLSDPETYGEESAPLEVVTAPSSSEITISVADAQVTSLSFTWNACKGATSYNLYNHSTEALLGSTTQPTFTWTGLAADTAYSFEVEPVRTSSSGFVARPTTVKVLSNVYTRPNKPVTPSTGAFGLGSAFYNINIVYLTANRPAGVDGYEIEVYQVKDNKKVFSGDSSNYRMGVKKNIAYKYRCRYYVTYNNEKIYGDWSGYRHFWFHNVKGTKYSNSRSSKSYIKVNWSKMAKAKNYTVYISTSEKGGYKKVKTLSAKTTKITIRKYGKKSIKKNKKYYVKVVAQVKDGKKAVKSDYGQVLQFAARR